ncbi:hypothetical protein N8Y37_02710 [Amylibacter sp.]|nr:hypothetical protein [Amylibacter sp.]
MSKFIEPPQAFPYLPPTKEVKEKYSHIFNLESQLPTRFSKLFFDKTTSFFLLVLFSPIIVLLRIAYVLEGTIIKENKGPMFFYYWGVSGGKKIKKWKLRLIKMKYIDPVGAASHDWAAFSAEWNAESRTYVGAFVKNGT